jgi:CTP synthase
LAKYVFITGGVLSSVGKGIVTSSVGKMLQTRGVKVTAIKVDPYVNVDAGTMNPYMHGEVYVTDDGGETDLDLGWYERFLNMNLTMNNNVTTGMVYQEVVKKERKGDYLGSCVQIVPHVTDEIKKRFRSVAEDSRSTVVLIECGGTVGDIEGLPFLEAIRQMRLEEGYGNTLYIHVALVPILDVTGEMKTKPLQHSVNELRRIGIQPDIIVARSRTLIQAEARQKIALFGTIPEDAVFCSYNVQSIYEVPLILDRQEMGAFIINRLKLSAEKPEWATWEGFVNAVKNPHHEINIILVGKYAGLADSYVSMNEAFRHSGAEANTRVTVEYINSEELEKNPEKIGSIKNYDGVFVPYGFGSRGAEGKIGAIEYARKNDIPFLGICYGFQLAVVEFARNVCGIDAYSVETNPDTAFPVIDLMPEQHSVKNKGATMRLGSHKILIEKGTLAHSLYKSEEIYERHRHRYEVNPKHRSSLEEHGLIFSGKSVDNRRMEILELPKNFFFFASQFHGEFKSRPGNPDPEYLGFVKACLDRKLRKAKT